MNLHLRSTYYCMPSAVPALGIQGAIKRNKEPCSCGACVSVEEDRQETRDNKEVNYIPVRRGSVLQEKKKKMKEVQLLLLLLSHFSRVRLCATP